MKIQLINPDIMTARTQKVAAAVREVAVVGTQILAMQSATGLASTESATNDAAVQMAAWCRPFSVW